MSENPSGVYFLTHTVVFVEISGKFPLSKLYRPKYL